MQVDMRLDGRAIAARLRERILSGELLAGVRLTEEDLAAHFGVSRAPVREALLQLQANGLVTLVPRHGATIARISVADLEETYFIRLQLEPVAMRCVAERATSGQVEALASLIDELALHLDDPNAFFVLNDRFFEEAFRLTPYTLLQEIITNLRQRTHYFRRQYVWLPGRTQRILRSRQALLAALRSRDLDHVEQLTREALQTSRDDLLRYLRKRSSEETPA